jgi:gluconolactonase
MSFGEELWHNLPGRIVEPCEAMTPTPASVVLSLLRLAALLRGQELPAPAAVRPAVVLRLPSFSEGIVFDHAGNGYVSHGKFITRFTPDGHESVWAEMGRPNGHKILADGSHLVCDGVVHAVVHLDAGGRRIADAATECDGRPLRAPNDLTLDPRGGFYFTDPGGSSPEHPIGTVHYVDAGGRTHQVASDLAFPNGIALSPALDRLLVAESRGNRILAFDVMAPGKLGPARTFAELPAKQGAQVDNQPDGICFDARGNLHVAHVGMGQIQVLDPAGQVIRRYDAGHLYPSNVAFGGPDLDRLYVTGKDAGVEGRLSRLDLPGARGHRILPARAAAAPPSPETRPPEVNPLGGDPEAVAAGARTFRIGCAVCHGDEGKGGRGPQLAGEGRVRRMSDARLFAAVRDGIPGTEMPRSTLADAGLWQLVAYLRALDAPAIGRRAPGDPARGEALFFGRGGCSGCHMLRGRGGLLGPDLSDIAAARSQDDLRRSVVDPDAYVVPGFQAVTVTTVAGRRIAGVARNRSNYSVQILDAGGNLYLLLASELAAADFSGKSPMPKPSLDEAELTDLVAFLARQALERPAPAAGAPRAAR